MGKTHTVMVLSETTAGKQSNKGPGDEWGQDALKWHTETYKEEEKGKWF